MNHDFDFGFIPLMETINRFKYDFKTNKTIVLETFVLLEPQNEFLPDFKKYSKVELIQGFFASFIFSNFLNENGRFWSFVLVQLFTKSNSKIDSFIKNNLNITIFWTCISLWSLRTFENFYQSSNYLGDIFCKVEEVPRNISDLLTTCF